MATVKRLYNRGDEWLKSRSRRAYAVFLGLSGGVGVLIAGLLMNGELLLGQALALACVMFGLECAFGLHQTTDG